MTKRRITILLAFLLVISLACILLDKYSPSQRLDNEYVTKTLEQTQAYRGYMAYRLKL